MTQYTQEMIINVARRYIFEKDLEPVIDNKIKIANTGEHMCLAYHYGGRSGHVFISIIFQPLYTEDGTSDKSILDEVKIFYVSDVSDKIVTKLIELF